MAGIDDGSHRVSCCDCGGRWSQTAIRMEGVVVYRRRHGHDGPRSVPEPPCVAVMSIGPQWDMMPPVLCPLCACMFAATRREVIGDPAPSSAATTANTTVDTTTTTGGDRRRGGSLCMPLQHCEPATSAGHRPPPYPSARLYYIWMCSSHLSAPPVSSVLSTAATECNSVGQR